MKTIRLLILGLFIFNIQVLFAQDPIIKQDNLKLISINELKPKMMVLSPVAKKAIQKGIKPGAFKNVQYTYSSNVKILNASTKNKLHQKMKTSPVLRTKQLKSIGLKNKTIYIDSKSDLVLKTAKVGKDSMTLVRPVFHEVFKNLIIPNQSVPINIANTSYTANNTEVTGKEYGDEYDMKMIFNHSLFEFEKEVKVKGKKTKTTIKIALDGFVGFNKPVVEAKLTKWDGYKLVFSASEHAEIALSADVKIDHEVSVPIWGYDIPISSIGSCKVGVFAVIDIHGSLHIEARLMQHFDYRLGVRGGTAYYVPTSVKKIKELHSYSDVNYNLRASLEGFGGVECTIDMKVKGYDILYFNIRGGAEIEAKIDTETKEFYAKIGLRFKVSGKVKKINKNFTLYNKYFLIKEFTSKDKGNYIFKINEVDAYRDRVWGRVLKKDSTNYVGNIDLIVIYANKAKKTYKLTTNSEGVFSKTEVPLKKGDKVIVKITNKPFESDAVNASLPFTEINIHYADYYTNRIEGNISARVDNFPVKKVHKAIKIIPKIVNTNAPKTNQKPKFEYKKIINFDPAILKESFKKAITYNGAIKIIIKGRRKGENQNNHDFIKNPLDYDKDYFTTEKNASVNTSAFSNFIIKNIDLKPKQRVRLVLNYEGFKVYSNYIKTDGLIIIPSIDKGFDGNISKPELSTINTYVYVSALRSNKRPQGKIFLTKGVDMRHYRRNNKTYYKPTQKIYKRFKQPLVFYNKFISLRGLTPEDVNKEPHNRGKGISVVSVGNWNIKNPFYIPYNLKENKDLDGHFFEFITYKYEGELLRYTRIQKKCSLDKYFWGLPIH